MSRISRVLLLLVLLIFALACNVVTQPFSDAQDVVETAQSLATAIPIETLQALPSAMPELEMPTGMPDFGDITDPQDEPLTEWKGIPIMPAATAGEESDALYNFKADASVEEVYDYYKAEMEKLGWTEFLTMPDAGGGALLTYQMDNHIATITITTGTDGGSLIFLTYQ